MPDHKPPKELMERDKLRGLVPASAEGRKDEVYASYLDTIGVEHRTEVHRLLATDPDPRFRRFLELMSTPGRVVKIQTVAKQCGISLAEFGNWFSKAANQIAIGTAQLRAAGIVEDMAGDALTRNEFCERCDGMGWVSAPLDLPMETEGYRILGMRTVKEKDGSERQEPMFCRTCPKCRGVKSVRSPGDEHSRDRVLEIAGLVSRGGKSAVQIVQNFGGAGHTSAVSGDLQALTIDASVDVE